MSLLELVASALTLASVILTSHLKRALYPVGIAATLLYAVVFWRVQLYASAALQVYFTLIQLYGWWYWSRGDAGKAPPIGDWSWKVIGLLALPATIITGTVALGLNRMTDASMPILDSAILMLSVLAQYLLDRKQMKHWVVWAVTNVIAVYVYAGQGLWWTTGLYLALLGNVGYGWLRWKRHITAQLAAQP